MQHFLVELQNRPDGTTNSSIKGYSSLANGLAQYYARASVAVTTKDYTSIALTLIGAEGDIIQNQRFETQYEAE